MRALKRRVLWLGVAATLSLPSAGAAEIPIGGYTLSGDVVTGERYYVEEPSRTHRGKYDEYRDNQDGVFLDRLNLRLVRPETGYEVDFGGSKWGHDDQDYYLGAGRLGLWQFGFEWDQTPHVYSSTARTLYMQPTDNVFTLPTPRPSLPTWNTSSRLLDEIEQRWDTAHVFFALTPTPDLDIRADYTRIFKHGDRPFGMAFASPGGNFAEILAPIDQTMHDVRLRATYSRDWWQVQAGYTFSMFHNEIKSVTADNPCFGLTASLPAGGCAGDATGAQTSGRVSLDPDNMAHTFTLGGGMNLPMRSRLTANFTYSLRLQDANFLPHTNNPDPALSSPLLALPQRNLDGTVGTTLLNVMATTRPLTPLTLTAHYRYYNYNDMSDTLTFPAHVVSDRVSGLTVENLTAHRFDYTRQNADLDGRWRFAEPLALTLGGGWEHWDRNDAREVPHSDEYFAKVAVDATPLDWLLGRLTYQPSWRRITSYNTFAPLTAQRGPAPDITVFQQGQSPLLTKFDEGERNTNTVNLMLQLSPLETFTHSINVQWRESDYIDSPLGLQTSTTWSAGFDSTWRPIDRLALSAGYVHELIFQKQVSRSRAVSGTTTLDVGDFDWISDSTDTVDTVHAGFTITLIPRALVWNTVASYSYALGEVGNKNPGPVTSGTAAQMTTARAKSWPAFYDQLVRLDSTFVYHFAKVWTASLGYAWESFDKHDWRTDTLNPFQPGVSSIWMGNDSRNYNVHSLIAKIGYRF